MFFLFRSKPRTQGWRGHLHRTTSSVLVAVQWLSQPLPLGRGSFLLSWASENIEGDWKKRSNHMFCCCFVRLRSDFVFWIVVIWLLFQIIHLFFCSFRLSTFRGISANIFPTPYIWRHFRIYFEHAFTMLCQLKSSTWKKGRNFWSIIQNGVPRDWKLQK